MQKCINCGAWYGLHQYETQLCPLGGIEETRPSHKQQWANTIFTQISEHELLLTTQREKLITTLHSLAPDFTEPDNLETKSLPELIELLITAAKYWREQAEN